MIRNKLILWVIALLVTLLPAFAPAHAKTSFSYKEFSHLPVMHQGRVKPMGRMAQLVFQDISGVKAPIHSIAAPWLADILFNPGHADELPIFVITEPNVLHVFELEKSDKGYYSFAQLNRAFIDKAQLILQLRKRDTNAMSADQLALLQLYEKVAYYEQLKHSLTLFIPLQDPAQKKLIAEQAEHNEIFRVIPINGSWIAPWKVYSAESTEFQNDALYTAWKNLTDGYRNENISAWQIAVSTVYEETLHRSGDTYLPLKLQTETAYNVIQPYRYSLGLYALAFLASLALLNKAGRVARLMPYSLLGAGFMLHLYGIISRIIILQRPPVSDLYESILFVGVVLVLCGLVFAWRNRDQTVIAAVAFLGAALQILGFTLNTEAETLQVLQAVLDTKFWLATHVIIITLGYAACLLTSAAAHMHLLRTNRKSLALNQKSFRLCYILAFISLLLICTGTLLGGVWADQSWGRFWGWDPKENGALLIALWLIWLLHGKVTGHFEEFGFSIGLSLMVLVVALSWIGVNLLGVGLHSYGFMDGSVTSLLVLFAAEFSFILFVLKRKRNENLA